MWSIVRIRVKRVQVKDARRVSGYGCTVYLYAVVTRLHTYGHSYPWGSELQDCRIMVVLFKVGDDEIYQLSLVD